jgi:hypothetical protein
VPISLSFVLSLLPPAVFSEKIYLCCPWTGLTKPGLQHVQFSLFLRSLGIPLFSFLKKKDISEQLQLNDI